MNQRLFTGQLVRLAAPNPDIDAEALARWSHDTEFHRLADNDVAYPESAQKIKEWLERSDDQSFRFAIRALADDRLMGTIGLWVESWTHREAWVGIGIGDRDCWGKGYGTDAMKLALRFAFDELNLDRVSLGVYAHNLRAIRSYEKAGFKLEGCVRGDCRRDRQRFDSLFMGILREEWLAMNNVQ